MYLVILSVIIEDLGDIRLPQIHSNSQLYDDLTDMMITAAFEGFGGRIY
jgi:hypothetical protein